MDNTSTIGIQNYLLKLVSIPSYYDKIHNEKEISDYVFAQLSSNKKLVVKRIPSEKNRNNIIAYDKDKDPKVILFGHLDTVLPKNDQNQSFKPNIADGKLYGLGAVDMKAGLAIMLYTALHNHIPGTGYVFSVDEEYEFKGTLELAKISNLNPKYIINLEPTDNKILHGCRGITEFSFNVHGLSAHAGRKHLGINAIEKSVELINIFQKLLTDLDDPNGSHTTINLSYLHGGVLQNMDKNKNPNISGLGMVVPNFAQLNCEIRVGNNKITKEFIQKNLLEIASKLNISISDIKFKFYLGALQSSKEKLSKFITAITEKKLPVQFGDINLSGFYELQIIQKKWKGIPIIFGPGPNSASHTVNEYVDLKSVDDCYKVIEYFIKSILV